MTVGRRSICGGALALLIGMASSGTVSAQDATWPLAGTVVTPSSHSFVTLSARLDAAVKEAGFAVVTSASASAGAQARGVAIAGNRVVGVFRNDYAVRMLDASLAAGIEAPLRFYLIEKQDGSSAVIYRKPSTVFAPYAAAALDALARELDPVWERIAKDAAR